MPFMKNKGMNCLKEEIDLRLTDLGLFPCSFSPFHHLLENADLPAVMQFKSTPCPLPLLTQANIMSIWGGGGTCFLK